MADVIITPALKKIEFTDSTSAATSIVAIDAGLVITNTSSAQKDRFKIVGLNGTLFSVTDDLTESLFAVHDLAGLPVMNILPDHSINIDGPIVHVSPGSGFTIAPNSFVSHIGTMEDTDWANMSITPFEIYLESYIDNITSTVTINPNGLTLVGSDVYKVILTPKGLSLLEIFDIANGYGANASFSTDGIVLNMDSTAGDFDVVLNAQQFRLSASTSSTELLYDTTSGLKLGTSTNYTQLGPDGTITLHGTATVFDDLTPASILMSKVGSSQPSLIAMLSGISQMQFGINNDVYGQTEITHEYKEGSNIEIHMHWATGNEPNASTVKSVRWELKYVIANNGGVFSGTATTVNIDDTIAIGEAANRHRISTALVSISGTNITIGAYILWSLKRVANGTAPTGNDPFGIALGFHIEKDTLGSNAVYTKY